MKKRIIWRSDTWQNGCFGKMDDYPFETTPNHHPSQFRCSSNNFSSIHTCRYGKNCIKGICMVSLYSSEQVNEENLGLRYTVCKKLSQKSTWGVDGLLNTVYCSDVSLTIVLDCYMYRSVHLAESVHYNFPASKSAKLSTYQFLNLSCSKTLRF